MSNVNFNQQADIQTQSNLTTAQFLMWMGQKLDPDAPLYNMIQTYRINGRIDPTLFKMAFDKLVRQSDALGAVIIESEGIPQMIVQDEPAQTTSFLDFSNEENPEETYASWEAKRKINVLPINETLFDSVLIKMNEDLFIWYMNMHHLITDGVAFELVYARMAEFYSLAVANKLDEAPELPKFLDFAAYERHNKESKALQKAKKYWEKKLETAVSPTDFYGQSAQGQSNRTDRIYVDLGADRSATLHQIATQKGFKALNIDLALFSIFGSILLTTLHRINGQTTLRFGNPYAGRPNPTHKQTIGLFIEIGPMQVEITPEDTFQTLAAKSRKEIMSGLMNVQPGVSSADLNRSYDVLLNYVNSNFGNFHGYATKADWVHTGYGDSNHNLRLQITDFDQEGNFRLAFDVNCAVFGDEERQWLIDHFLRVTDTLIADPQQTITQFNLLADDEVQHQLVAFNQTEAAYPHDHSVVQLFEAQVVKTPNAIAAVRGDEQITYAELNEKANQLAHFLIEAGVGPETAVALILPRSIELFIAIWGVLKAGGTYVPIDSKYPAERVDYMLEDAAPKLALVSEKTQLTIANCQLSISNWDDNFGQYASTNPTPMTKPSNLVYMIYTSGSTGKPKGTMLTHQGLVNYIWWAKRVYQDNSVMNWPLYSSLAFDLTVTSIFTPLVCGGTAVIYSEQDHVQGLEILKVFEDDAVDIVKLTPAHLSLVQESAINCSKIRKLIVGGEAFKTDLAQTIFNAFDGNVDIYNEYGPTEAVVGCMIHKFDINRDTAVDVPIGTPADNARIYLLDTHGNPVPTGVIGEMHISSDGVARGYRNRPDLTAEKFIDDPFRPGKRMYKTGDLARWDNDGNMLFLGRRDHQVKINGARIELGEIEAEILSHPSIQEAVVHVVQYEKRPELDNIIFCVRCGLPSNYPDTTFDDQNVCSTCRDFETFRDEVFTYFGNMDDLDRIVTETKAEATGQYDCISLLSGGKDSTFVLAQLVEMGLKPLAFTLDNGFISEDALENVRRVTEHLGVDLVVGKTPHMNAIFADSLDRHANVCHGCFKTIYTLSTTLAKKKGIKTIFTGLSRGQLFETRLDELFRNRIFGLQNMDNAIMQARKVYHRIDDAVYRLLDVEVFKDDRIFNEIRFVDYFRYTDVELDEMYEFLSTRVPWIRPRDTGRSTNCLINEMGIFVHKTERGYHNYALPYSWDVILGHKTRAAALEELDDEMRMPMINQMLNDVGYEVKYHHGERSEKRLAVYYVSDESLSSSDLRQFMADQLPSYMVPAYFVRLQSVPLTTNGKVDRTALPNPTESRPDIESIYIEPESDIEIRLADIWAQTLNLSRVGIHDNFFELGGNSVPAVQIIARVNEQFGIELPIRTFFEQPTVEKISEAIEQVLIDQIESMSDEEAEALLLSMG
ncbi:MAG: amino acid adenylation domain-containing protein [Chloroflexota bacterium]